MHSIVVSLATMSCLLATSSLALAAPEPQEVETLLTRLDLNRPGLEKVKSAPTPDAAARALLDYYRARTSIVNLEADRRQRDKVRGNYASPEDIAIAADAVKNILIAAPVYPRYNFGDKIDWFTNRSPKKDTEWLVQLHRHYSWDRLGKAYWHTGDEKYAAAYVRQLLDWIANCPVEEKGRKAWGTLEVGIRGHSWTLHWNWFLDSPSYTPEVLVRQMNSFWEHANRLTAGRGFTRNNWGLMEAEGTAFIAINFPEFKDADAWRKKAVPHLAGEVDKQIASDGMQAEMCFGYHGGSIRWLGRTLALARANGMGGDFPPKYEKTIERMYEVVGLFQHPNGCSTMFGDDRPHNNAGVLRRGAAEFTDNPVLAFLASGGKAGSPPPTAQDLPVSGLYSLRSGWDADAVHLILKCGRDGGWHCQPDNGTFELFAYGRYLMPDSGCYIYHGDEEGRKWFRQTRVHQTLTLDGKDSAYAAKLLLWKPGGTFDALVVENASYKDLTHRRAVLFVDKSCFVIIDEARGAAAGDVDVHFQLAPGTAVVEPATFSARTALAGGPNVFLQSFAQPGLVMEAEEGQVSLEYGKKEPRPAMRFRLKKTASDAAVHFVTVVAPYRGDKPPAVKINRIELSADSARVLVRLSIDGKDRTLGYDLARKEALSQP